MNMTQDVCVLCGKNEDLSSYEVPPAGHAAGDVVLCRPCLDQIERKAELTPDYWRFLPDAMWSEVPAVQVLAWRMLTRLKNESWAAEALDVLYLDEETEAWAKAVGEEDDFVAGLVHRDSNGAILQTGDTVVLTKTLDVKGSQISARMGTVVKNIRVVEDNAEQIEGKVEGQQIVILTKYVRKQNV